MKLYPGRRLTVVSLLSFLMVATSGAWGDTAYAVSVCRPGTEATCRPADAVDAVGDYLHYLKGSSRDRIEVDALYELFSYDVRKKLSRKKFAGILEDFFGSSFSLTHYTVDSKVTSLNTGEVACRVSIHYVIYLNSMLTSRSMNAVFHVRYEDGEWRLSRSPSYAGGYDYQGMFP